MLTQPRHTSGDVGTFYNRHTDVYDQALGGNIHVGYWDDDKDDSSVQAATDRLTDLVTERLVPAEGQHLLDVGCGHGSTAARIVAHHAVRITGISVSDYQVDLANSRPLPSSLPGRATFQLADAMENPFDDETFDGAYAIESLMHMKDKQAAVGHIARVLRPGGRLVIAEHSLAGELEAPDAARMADAYAYFKFSLTTDMYGELLREAGLEVVDHTDITDNVRRCYDGMISGWRDAADNSSDETSREWATAADLGEWFFCKVPQLRYGLLTAVRH
ncbi:methyltransferase domain-containing protein [Streptomyces actuosus]|uniref:Methyltransferase domain-containing protein n=1 Tax=Streptomyces actuosus TaxID=1885 RepID=A0ABS2VIK9_STRAS|nr:methyltransferase domain-containing protein [Streptomyces actuosus]MBN0042926.1 methyltransferase domain-containing protein [Streptomyces actuosus]